MIYDVCFLLLQSIAHDARTLNLARTLAKNEKKVLLLGIGTESDSIRLAKEGITFTPLLPPDIDTKLSLRWMKFHTNAYLIRRTFEAGIYCAEDVFTLPTAFMLASKHCAKVVYDSREIFSALASNHSRPLRQKIISSLERYYAPKLTRVFTSGKLDSEYLASYLGIPLPEVVMNLPQYSTVSPTNLLRERYEIPKDMKILLYQGWIAEGRGILEAVKALRHIRDVVFCLLGDGDFQTTVREVALQEGVERRVLFCGKVSYDELPLWTASADAGLCYIEPISLSYSLALPNKLFEYCMAGIPSLVSDLPAMRQVLEQFPIGKLIPANSTPTTIATAIQELFEESYRRRFNQIQETAARTYCWENQESTVLTIFAS